MSSLVDPSVLAELADRLVSAADRAGADAADAVAVRSVSLGVEVRDGAVEESERSEGDDVGLRVFVGRRQAVVSTNDVNADVAQLAARAVAMARAAPADPFAGLADPKLLPYRFLIVDHTESTGRRDPNLALSQRRADSIREVLVGTFKISGKRLQSLGLGEEQLQDAVRPASPANIRAQIMTVGLTPVPPPAAAVPPAQKSAAKSPKAAKKRH